MIKINCFGIVIKFDFIFFAIITLFTILDKSGVGLLGLLACIMHEIGHIIAFILVGNKPKELAFEGGGMKLVKGDNFLSYHKELIILLSGSLVNFIMFFIFYFSTDTINNISIFAMVHLVLGIFNLLPINTLDGAKILNIILSKKTNPIFAQKAINSISFIVIVLLVVISVKMCFSNNINIILVFTSVYLILMLLFKLKEK